MVKNNFFLFALSIGSIAFFPTWLQADQNPKKNPIIEHLADSHAWHFTTIGNRSITLYLPVILYKKGDGWYLFSSQNLWNSHHQASPYQGFILKHNRLEALDGSKIYDFSITKNVASILLSMLILLLIFFSLARYHKRNQGKVPRGGWLLLTYLVDLVRNQIVKPNIDAKNRSRFTPYLLTLFFFIWINNFMGLLPGAANVTGNITVVFMLALSTFLVINIYGSSYYWKHIFSPPGIPKWVLPMLVPIEIISLFIKPFTLMLRLFGNILVGHILLLTIIGLIFSLKSVLGVCISVPFGTFIIFLELFVGFLQAYIFTLLSAIYIGIAVKDHA